MVYCNQEIVVKGLVVRISGVNQALSFHNNKANPVKRASVIDVSPDEPKSQARDYKFEQIVNNGKSLSAIQRYLDCAELGNTSDNNNLVVKVDFYI